MSLDRVFTTITDICLRTIGRAGLNGEIEAIYVSRSYLPERFFGKYKEFFENFPVISGKIPLTPILASTVINGERCEVICVLPFPLYDKDGEANRMTILPVVFTDHVLDEKGRICAIIGKSGAIVGE